MFDDDRPGCLGGLLRLLVLTWIFDWLQDNIGFGRGCSGFGCGMVLMVLFFIMACGIICGTNWLNLFSAMPF
jgi:hypothetical protein